LNYESMGKCALLTQIEDGRPVSSLTLAELTSLCAELRHVIIETVGRNGGHLSPNLGVVELTAALHAVFHLPDDKIVWDVGHQCYAHKLLTGRYTAFSSLRQQGGIAGFPRTSESPCDVFNTGHASTSISVALGLLAGEHLAGNSAAACSVVAVIGDGALTGGLAYEALSCAAHLALPLIIILNDNRMSISPNVGGLSRHLSRLSMRPKYQTFRTAFDSMTLKIPLAGKALFNIVQRLKRAVKAVFYQDNFFVELGFEYVGPIDGHNLKQLTGAFADVKARTTGPRPLASPVVVHVITQKGRGYAPAEDDPGRFHSTASFLHTADDTAPAAEPAAMPWTRIFGTALAEAAREDSRICAITAAMERGTGLSLFKKEFPGRFFDAGIAEAHAVTFSAALAARGLRPVTAIYSTFIQRAIDSVIHDTAIASLPVVFALDRAGFVGGDGETHQGLFDIALLRTVPGITIMEPAVAAELPLMLHWALAQNHPCVIRYPKAEAPKPDTALSARLSVPLTPGRGVFVKGGIDFSAAANSSPTAAVCLAFTGSLLNEALETARLLNTRGADCDLYNLRFLSPLDETFFTALVSRYRVFALAEEGVGPGGLGEYAARLAADGTGRTTVVLFNAGAAFYTQGSRAELLRRAGLDGASIARRLSDILEL
jgi:1-deoxy-D-xylulose-5-phosphate synthase